MNENKLTRTALTGIHWYDFVGTDYLFEDFQQIMKNYDQVVQSYHDMYTLYLVEEDVPSGETYSKYYYHKELCDEILQRNQIDSDPYRFILQSHVVIYEGKERKAITEMYEKDVSNSIVRYLK